MAERVARFTAELVATWLKKANRSGRAPWRRLPDATVLAAQLSDQDFFDEYTPHHIAGQQVRGVTRKMRGLAAAFNDPKLSEAARSALIIGAAQMLSAAHPDAVHRVSWQEREDADIRSLERLSDDPLKLSGLLELGADAAERAHACPNNLFHTLWPTHADYLRVHYRSVAHILAQHTGTPTSINPRGPDARFCREVIKYVGLLWHSRLWRRLGEERAARDR
jgi:hypothetical protein